MKFKYFLIPVLWLHIAWGVNAASENQQKAMAYYFAAEEAYISKNYAEAISRLEKTKSLLGSNNAKIILLEIKVKFEQKEYGEVKKLLDDFFKYQSDNQQKKEVSTYLVKVDEKLEAMKRAEEQRLARIAAEKEIRLAKQRKAEEQKRKQNEKNYQSLHDIMGDLSKEYVIFKDAVRVRKQEKMGPYLRGEITSRTLRNEGQRIAQIFEECESKWGSDSKRECHSKLDVIRASYEKKQDLFKKFKSSETRLVIYGRTSRLELKKKGLSLCEQLKNTEYAQESNKYCEQLKKVRSLVQGG